jgi:hypothetical protein
MNVKELKMEQAKGEGMQPGKPKKKRLSSMISWLLSVTQRET